MARRRPAPTSSPPSRRWFTPRPSTASTGSTPASEPSARSASACFSSAAWPLRPPAADQRVLVESSGSSRRGRAAGLDGPVPVAPPRPAARLNATAVRPRGDIMSHQVKYVLDESAARGLVQPRVRPAGATAPGAPSGHGPARRSRRPRAALPDADHPAGGLDRSRTSPSRRRSATSTGSGGRRRSSAPAGSSRRSRRPRASTTSTRASPRPGRTSRTPRSPRRSTTSRRA